MSTLLMAAVATLVFCAPGYPGGAGDAQPFLDKFASATVATVGWPAGSLAAVYDPTEQGGLQKLGSSEAVLAFVPYAFFVQHAAQLHLTPLAQADMVGIGPQERWTLVAPITNGCEGGRPSRVVLAPRRWSQVRSSGARTTVANKPGSPRRSRSSRKPLRGECRVVPV